jgi:hypothetical protein
VQIKDRQKLLVILALVAVVLFAGEHLVADPLINLWKVRAARKADLQKKVTDGTRLVQRERGVRDRWDSLERNTLTNNMAAAEQQVYRAIDRWAQESRVTINAITPQWKQEADLYKTLECRVEAAGDLERLSRFLYGAEREPLALRLESLELGARDKEGRQLTLGLQFSALVLLPPAPQGVAAVRTARANP